MPNRSVRPRTRPSGSPTERPFHASSRTPPFARLGTCRVLESGEARAGRRPTEAPHTDGRSVYFARFKVAVTEGGSIGERQYSHTQPKIL